MAKNSTIYLFQKYSLSTSVFLALRYLFSWNYTQEKLLSTMIHQAKPTWEKYIFSLLLEGVFWPWVPGLRAVCAEEGLRQGCSSHPHLFKRIVFFLEIHILQERHIRFLSAVWKLLPQNHLISQIINVFFMQNFFLECGNLSIWFVFCGASCSKPHIFGLHYTCISISPFMPGNSVLLNKGSFYCPFWSPPFFFLLILWASSYSSSSLDRVRLSRQNPGTLSQTPPANSCSFPVHRMCVSVRRLSQDLSFPPLHFTALSHLVYSVLSPL